MHFFINKNGHILDLIDYKKFVPKSGIELCIRKEVVFSDGSRQVFDVVIVSTGYKPAFLFLPKQYTQKLFCDQYKHIYSSRLKLKSKPERLEETKNQDLSRVPPAIHN